MSPDYGFRLFTLPKNRRLLWAIVQTALIPLAFLYVRSVVFDANAVADWGGHVYYTAVIWFAFVQIPYSLQAHRHYKKYRDTRAYKVGGILFFCAPFLYFRNLYLIVKQED